MVNTKQKARELNLNPIIIRIASVSVISNINGKQYIDGLEMNDLIKILREELTNDI